MYSNLRTKFGYVVAVRTELLFNRRRKSTFVVYFFGTDSNIFWGFFLRIRYQEITMSHPFIYLFCGAEGQNKSLVVTNC